MATIKQGVNYEITADDKTQAATDSALKRLEEMRAKERAAEKERKEAQEKQNAETRKSKALVQALGAAATGSWQGVAKALGAAVGGAKALNAAMMKFTIYVAIVTAVVKAVKALVSAFSAAKNMAEKIQFGNAQAGLESAKKHAEAFGQSLDRTLAKQEAAASAIDRQLEATKALKDAQDDYNRALELSLAKTDEERRAIERKYAVLKDATGEETAAAKRENARTLSDAKIANMEERLASLRDDERFYTEDARTWNARAARNARGIGLWNRIGSYFSTSQSADEKAKDQYAYAASAQAEAQKAQKEIMQLEADLEAERERRRLMDLEERAARTARSAVVADKGEKLAGEDAEKSLDEYARWRASGTGETFAEWRRRDADEAAEKTSLRQRQYREWLREMGRDAPENIGGAAFARFSKMKDDEDAAAAKAEAERQAADEQRAIEEARTREAERGEAERERIRREKIDATAAYQMAKDESSVANARLAAAQSAVRQAWGWYRDKDSLVAQLEEEKANAEAQRQYEKDFARLSFRSDWRTATNLSVDQEAVRRVALAKEEEAAAQKAVEATAENTRRAAVALESIESAFAEGGD